MFLTSKYEQMVTFEHLLCPKVGGGVAQTNLSPTFESRGTYPPATSFSYASEAATSSEMFRDIGCKRSFLRPFSVDFQSIVFVCVCVFFFFFLFFFLHYLFISFISIYSFDRLSPGVEGMWFGISFSFYYILRDRAGSRKSAVSPILVFFWIFCVYFYFY